MPAPLAPFHLAVPVHDLALARRFYGELLGCAEGRSAPTWVDFDFFGHQLVAHLDPEHPGPPAAPPPGNEVDGHEVPVPHFGLVLAWEGWEALTARLQAAGVAFVVQPHVRFRGKVGEQATCFFLDPSGNAVELKAFRDPTQLFARD